MYDIQYIRNHIDNISIDIIENIPCNIIHKYFGGKERTILINKIIDYYYLSGFPYYNLNVTEKITEYTNVINSTVNKIEIDGELQQNMAGLSYVNSFHPEMFNVVCNKSKTPFDVFNNRDLFYHAIDKRIGLSDSPLKPFNIRKSLKVFSGVQSTSNFRPTIAKYIYDKYCCSNGATLDPCAGYGGRLMGAYCSDAVARYVGVDPNSNTISNNYKMLDDLNMISSLINSELLFDYRQSKDINFITLPFEDVVLGEKFDLIFTSPPYFNIEKYSNDETQSWVRYKTFNDWIIGFLQPLINKSFDYLKDDGYFIINIDGGEILRNAFLKNIGGKFELVEILKMRLSKIMGNGDKDKIKFKIEPIYVCKK